MIKLFFKDLFNVMLGVADGIKTIAVGLVRAIVSLIYLILFIPIQMCLSVFYLVKYVVRNRRVIAKANREELERIVKYHEPTKYYCLGLRLNNYLVIKNARKRLETI